MAVVTVVSKPYGYRCHTGDELGVISTDKLRIKGIICWGTATNTAVFTEGDGSTLVKFTIATSAKSEYIPLWGMSVDGLSVIQSAALESRVILE
jgi:hypothetical protein